MSFTVLGRAEPQGSIRAFMVKGRPRLTSDNAKMKPWRQQVGMTALAERGNFFAGRNQAVRLIVSFYLKPPVKLPKGRTAPTAKPDIDKLLRSVGDALTGILFADDCQLCQVFAHKIYGVPEMTKITVELM
jgi:Holliday junction resolvase RusA-like endonuclease